MKPIFKRYLISSALSAAVGAALLLGAGLAIQPARASDTTTTPGATNGRGYVFQATVADSSTRYIFEVPGKLIGKARCAYYGTWNARNIPFKESMDGTNYGALLDSDGAAIAPTADGEQQVLDEVYGPVKQITAGPASGSGTSVLVTCTVEAT